MFLTLLFSCDSATKNMMKLQGFYQIQHQLKSDSLAPIKWYVWLNKDQMTLKTKLSQKGKSLGVEKSEYRYNLSDSLFIIQSKDICTFFKFAKNELSKDTLNIEVSSNCGIIPIGNFYMLRIDRDTYDQI